MQSAAPRAVAEGMSDSTRPCPYCHTEIDARAIRCPSCTSRMPDAPGMHRGVPGKLVGGVCAALAQQLNLDLTLVRVLFAVCLTVTAGTALWIYALLWVMTPLEAGGKAPAVRFGEWVSSIFTSRSEAPPSSQG